MAKKKKAEPDYSDRLVNVKHRALLSDEAWREAGRPLWVVAVAMPDGPENVELVYYRCIQPLNEPLNLFLRTLPGTVGMKAGTLVEGHAGMADVHPVIIPWNDPVAVNASPGWGFSPSLYLTWDRGLTEATAQRFATAEELP